MKLYFERSNGEMVFISNSCEKCAEADIRDHVKKINPNYTIYYIRYWNSDKDSKFHRIYDVGSHTEFFHLIDEGE